VLAALAAVLATAAMLAATAVLSSALLSAPVLATLTFGLLLLLPRLVLSAALLSAVASLLILLTGLVLATLAVLFVLVHDSCSCETIPTCEQSPLARNVPGTAMARRVASSQMPWICHPAPGHNRPVMRSDSSGFACPVSATVGMRRGCGTGDVLEALVPK
jgi:hypothetical protein